MNGRTVLIGTCVVGSLVGLGFLARYVYGAEQEAQDEQENIKPDKHAERNEHNSYNRTKKRPLAKRHKGRPQVKPEPKVEMVEVKEQEPPIADEFPLRFGSEGKRVERLQVWLMRNYGWTGKITGVLDEKTEALLKRFLKKVELDEATYYKMKMEKPVYEQIVMR